MNGLIEALHFKQDPELLIVHHLPSWDDWDRPSVGTAPEAACLEGRSWRYKALRSVLPEEAGELRGYPFWALRLSEI